jgi:hypothetical protein
MTRPTPFAPGDAVKLTDRYANTLCSSIKTKHVDWRGRRGIVRGCGASQVAIMWPGRTSPDRVEINGVELVKGAAE